MSGRGLDGCDPRNECFIRKKKQGRGWRGEGGVVGCEPRTEDMAKPKTTGEAG